jgi:hypothetical protein
VDSGAQECAGIASLGPSWQCAWCCCGASVERESAPGLCSVGVGLLGVLCGIQKVGLNDFRKSNVIYKSRLVLNMWSPTKWDDCTSTFFIV